MLPYTAAVSRLTSPAAIERVARALGGADGPAALHALMLKAADRSSLRAMGLTQAALEKAADLASRTPTPTIGGQRGTTYTKCCSQPMRASAPRLPARRQELAVGRREGQATAMRNIVFDALDRPDRKKPRFEQRPPLDCGLGNLTIGGAFDG